MGRGRALGTDAQEIGAYAAILQPIGCRFPVHVAGKPIELGQLAIANWRRHTDWILLAATRRRNTALVDTDLAHLAAVALVDATLEELGAVTACSRSIKRVYFHFVVCAAAAWWLQAFPAMDEVVSRESNKQTGLTHIASVRALRHLSRSCSDLRYRVKAVLPDLRANNS